MLCQLQVCVSLAQRKLPLEQRDKIILPSLPMKLRVVFEDQDLIVFDKPPGLIVTKSETQDGKTLEDILVDDYKINIERGGVVHRLDKDTSGLIVAAKSDLALANLQEQFKTREVKKSYLALVHGIVKNPGRIEGAIGRNPGDREKFVVFNQEGGKEATTEYTPLEQRIMSEEMVKTIFPDFNKIQMRKISNSNYSLFTMVECYPLTGRTHQIRVHLKHIGFPIVGDGKYVGRKTSRLDHRWCKRQFLHATKLSFKHPTNGKEMRFESLLAEDLQQAWNRLTPYLSS